MAIERRIAENTFWLFLGRVLIGILHLVTMALLARYLGVVNYGKFVFALAFLAFFNVFSVFGVDTVLIREISRNKAEASRLIGCGFIIKIFFSFLAITLTIFFTILLDISTESSKIIFILSIAIGFNIFRTPKIIFEVYLKSQYLVFIELTGKALALILVYIASALEFNLYIVAFVILLSEIPPLILFIKISKKFIALSIIWDTAIIKYLLKECWPLATMAILVTLYYRIDTIMLSFLKGDEAVGYYNGAYIILSSLLLLPDAYVRSVFPLMSNFYKTGILSLAKTFIRSFKYLITAAMLIVCVGFMLSKEIILFLYGEDFLPSARALEILIFAGGIIFISTLVSTTLTAVNKQRINMWLSLINVFCNIVLNLLLIPKWSYIGASIATVITEGIGCVFAFMINLKNFEISFLKWSYLRYLTIGIPIALSVVPIKALQGFHILMIIPLVSLAYLITLLILQWFDDEDKNIIREIMKG
jgi:O-antigen/teichoic acid export membrane protein